MICVLDAGHGKETAGKRSFDGSLLEWEFNRDVARKIRPHLERYNIEVILTAPDDTDVPLVERIQIANDAKADIFISLHANAYGTDWNDANGWEAYHYPNSAKGFRLALAIREHSINYLGLRDRGIKTSPVFDVVAKTKMAAVLIEHGFYTNKAEVELLKSSEFREKCAVSDAKGILSYYGIEWQENYKALYESALIEIETYRERVRRIAEIAQEGGRG